MNPTGIVPEDDPLPPGPQAVVGRQELFLEQRAVGGARTEADPVERAAALAIQPAPHLHREQHAATVVLRIAVLPTAAGQRWCIGSECIRVTAHLFQYTSIEQYQQSISKLIPQKFRTIEHPSHRDSVFLVIVTTSQ